MTILLIGCTHDRKVAIKILHAELAAVLGAERFLQEIRVTPDIRRKRRKMEGRSQTTARDGASARTFDFARTGWYQGLSLFGYPASRRSSAHPTLVDFETLPHLFKESLDET